MNARKLIAATLFALAGSAMAADAPAQTAASSATVAAGATAAATATAAKAPVAASTNVSNLNLPALGGGTARSREAVRAEAVEAVKNHQTTLSQQLAFIK